MPLSKASSRELLHNRDITVRGYRRADGNFDVEAHLVDTKPYSFPNRDRGEIPAGEPLHDMWIRMTVDEDLRILACEAVTEQAPYAMCPGATPNFANLAGLTIGRGFLKAANQRVGGVRGCTHHRELLQQLGTVAFQTLWPVRMKKAAAPAAAHRPPALLNSCYTFASDSPVVAERWPEFYTGPRAKAPEPAPSK